MDSLFLEINYCSSFNEELNIINFDADLRLHNMETNEEFSIGYARFYLFNSYLFSEWFDVVDSADAVSGDLHEVLVVLSDYKDDEEIAGKILVLDFIQIHEEYRNQGWGSHAMNDFLHYWNYLDVNYFALKPAPSTKASSGNERRNYIERLIQFYSKFGFTVLQSPKVKEPCMGKNLNYLD
ncbi:GNAT family N-acetyltransferase [Mesobacillus maritimus]|uniref:GNAT family N-acetyltransferase n=1 Tax=Mesobacillus maritimus TaxID=1643336 RepID=A0ABS7K955_9BACI|nr:GNAT family N-acetyltransferase [Mesobacillus maritimus]MBY0098802.1 GNAT family N-acetyltransferase [Mesobacillus maritimus]